MFRVLVKKPSYRDISMETPTFISDAVLNISVIENSLHTSISTSYMQSVCLVVFIVSCLSPLSFILALIMTAINIIFLVFYSQHLYVNIKTMLRSPCVLRQPTLPDRDMTSY